MIHYEEGDVLDSDAQVIAHGCNCRGGFGSGVAKAVATRYPKARHYYLDKHDEDGWKLGDVQFVTQWNGVVIANCATQDAYLPRGILHADYDAIRKCLEQVRDYAKALSKKIAMPKIGAGLAGGDWATIENILNDVFTDYDVTVYYLKE